MFSQGGQLHRYSALLLLLLCLYASYNVLINPALLARSEAEQQYAAAQLQYEKYQALAVDLPQVQARSEALGKNKIDGSNLLAAESHSLAVAELQQLVRKAVQQSGARLVSMQPLEAQQEDGFIPVKLRLNLRLTDDVLMRFLHRLEGMKPRGLVNSLQIQQQAKRIRGQRQAVSSQLNVRLEFTSYMAAG